MILWENNHVQFARLLAEIHGKADKALLDSVCEEMDLVPGDVEELFNRAEIEWMRYKEISFADSNANETRPAGSYSIRKKTPDNELEAFTAVDGLVKSYTDGSKLIVVHDSLTGIPNGD